MHRTADLLIKQNIAGELLDAAIRTDGELAKNARTCVGVQHGIEILLALLRGGFNDLAVLEDEFNAIDFTPPVDRGVGELDPPIYRVLNRPGENLAIREVALAIGIDEGTTLD